MGLSFGIIVAGSMVTSAKGCLLFSLLWGLCCGGMVAISVMGALGMALL